MGRLPLLYFCLQMLTILPGLTGCSGQMNASEKMMWSTYPLVTQKGAATGFIVNHRDPRTPGGRMPVVFTAAHLIETLGKGPLLIGIRLPGRAEEIESALLVFSPPKMTGEECFYVRHPDHDLVAFALHLPEDFNGCELMASFLDERMLARDGKLLHSGVEVSFFGYPEVLPGTDGGFPVLRSGRVASYPVGTSQSQGRFLINSDVYPGDSGAPVIISNRKSHPEVVGMIIQRIGQGSQNDSRFAIAVDADALRETLRLLRLSESRPVPVLKKTAPKTSMSGFPSQLRDPGGKAGVVRIPVSLTLT